MANVAWRALFVKCRSTAFRVCRVLALLALAACAGPSASTPASVTLRIGGSTSMIPVLKDLAQAYEGLHGHVLVRVQGGGSYIGLADLQAGRVDLAAVSWKPDDERPPAGFQAVPIAQDAVAIVVHPANRVRGLTLLQIRAIYRGELLDWSAVGGLGEEPLVISREDGSGTRAAFETLVMGRDRVTFNALVMPSSSAVVDYVARHRAAIGYVSMSHVTDRVAELAVEEIRPTALAVRSGTYHLTRLLYLFAPASAPAETRAFLEFVLSPAGQAIVARYHVSVR